MKNKMWKQPVSSGSGAILYNRKEKLVKAHSCNKPRDYDVREYGREQNMYGRYSDTFMTGSLWVCLECKKLYRYFGGSWNRIWGGRFLYSFTGKYIPFRARRVAKSKLSDSKEVELA